MPAHRKTCLKQLSELTSLCHERTFYVSFDENPSEVVRDLSSVGIRLGPHLKSGVLRTHSARTEASSAEVHLMKIKRIVREYQSRCMVVDPLSAIVKAGAALTAGRVAERLICLAKSEGITLVSTSLLQGAQPLIGGDARANLDNCGHLDSPHEHQSGWGTESHSQHRQIARYEKLQPSARTHPERSRDRPGRCLHGCRRRADGYGSLAERSRRESRAGTSRSRAFDRRRGQAQTGSGQAKEGAGAQPEREDFKKEA